MLLQLYAGTAVVSTTTFPLCYYNPLSRIIASKNESNSRPNASVVIDGGGGHASDDERSTGGFRIAPHVRGVINDRPSRWRQPALEDEQAELLDP
jgi:hypothetical protein